MLGCGVATGWGAVFNNCKLEPQSSVVVYGLGALGLAAIQAAKVRIFILRQRRYLSPLECIN